MDNTLVSIIVPVYNTAEYVEECIRSILSQSYKNIELILVNDGSKDGSDVVCKKYEHLPNVHYVEQENQGVTAARKRGADEAKGEWIMFVDSDDVISQNAVDVFLSKSKGVDIVVGGISESCKEYPPNLTRDEYLLMMYAKNISSSPCAKLFRKQLFNDKTLCYDRSICRWEDWLMNLQIAKNNHASVNTVSELLYVYRMRSNSSSHTYIMSFDELEKLCSISDEIVGDEIACKTTFSYAKMENRIKLFLHEILLNGFHNEPNHPFVIDVKRSMDESGVWRPMDRWLLSVSSPFVVKMAWNVRRIIMKLVHLPMIKPLLLQLYNFYRHHMVQDKYPMLSSLSKKEWMGKGAMGLVYMLHHVEEINPQGILGNQCLKVSPVFLEKIIIKYQKKGFDFISLDDLYDIISSRKQPQGPFVTFTLDDGYLDNYTNAFPIFKKYQVPFTIFVATDFIDKKAILWWDVIENLILTHDEIITNDGNKYPCYTERQKQETFNLLRERVLLLNQANLEEELRLLFDRYDIDWYFPIKEKGMSWELIKELSESPLCTIGGHTVTHSSLRLLSDDDVRKEIKEGVAKLKTVTGKKVEYFSYPYGSPKDVGEREFKLIDEFSFKTAFCSRGGCIIPSKSDTTCLPRVPLREFFP